MKRVLVVAPTFAPSSLPPTHRVRFFARHLPGFGWTPEILSVDPRFYEEPPDPEISRLIPPALRVTRAPALPVRWTRPFGVGDLAMRSFIALRAVLRTICVERRPDVILIPGPPWHTFLLGPIAKREFGIPFVMDYIDPWVNALGADGRWWTKAYWFREMAKALEPLALREVSQVVAVSEGTNDGVRARHPEMPASMFTGIPYGFEASDFDELRAHPRPNQFWEREDGRVHLVYVGAMLPKGYETLRALFGALADLGRDDPIFYERLRLHFFGTTYAAAPTEGLVEPIAREMGVADIVEERPARISYLDALNVMCSAHGILALGSTERHYTASKIFPCILSKRPLLAIYHEASSVCDVVRKAGAGELVTYSDTERAGARRSEIAAAVRRVASGVGYDPARVRWEHFAEYSAENMTRRLAAVLDGVVGAVPAERAPVALAARA